MQRVRYGIPPLILILLLAAQTSVRSAETPSWSRTYIGGVDAVFNSLVPAGDGTFFVAGEAGPYKYDSAGAWVGKVDATGNLLWEKYLQSTPEGQYTSAITSLVLTSGGGGVATAFVELFNDPGPPAMSYPVGIGVVWLGGDGSLIRSNIYRVGTDVRFYANPRLAPAPDGGFLLGFSADGDGDQYSDIIVLRLDAGGAVLKKWVFSRTPEMTRSRLELADLVSRDDGGFSVASTGSPYYDGVWAAQVNAVGEVAWQHIFYLEGYTLFRPPVVRYASDGGLFLAALPISGSTFILVRLTSEGQILWGKAYSVPDTWWQFFTLDQLSCLGDSLLLSGTGNELTLSSAWAAECDQGGEVLRARSFGDSSELMSRGAQSLPDGGFIMVLRRSTGALTKAAGLLRADSQWQVPIPSQAVKMQSAALVVDESGSLVLGPEPEISVVGLPLSLTSSELLVYRQGSPGTIPPLAVTGRALTLTSAKSGVKTLLGGNVNPNGGACEAWIEWGTDPALTSPGQLPLPDPGSGTTARFFSSPLIGTVPGTTYYCRLAASNANGIEKGRIHSFIAPLIDSSDVTTWARTLGVSLIGSGSFTDWGTGLATAEGGGFLASGFVEGWRRDSVVNIIVKTDRFGRPVKVSRLIPAINIMGLTLRRASDGGYLEVGEVADPPYYTTNNLVVKLSSEGTVAWARRVNNPEDPGSDSPEILPAEDGGAFVVARWLMEDYTANLVRLDKDGNLLWKRAFLIDPWYGYPFLATAPHGGVYLLMGHRVVRLNALGDIVWQKAYDLDSPYHIGPLTVFLGGGAGPGESLLVIARTYGLHLYPDTLIFQIDASGSPQWEQLFHTAHEEFLSFKSITAGSRGGYLLGGGTNYGQPFLIKLGASGSLEWQRVYGQPVTDNSIGAVIPLADGFAALGSTGLWGAGGNDLLLLRTDLQGRVAPLDREAALLETFTEAFGLTAHTEIVKKVQAPTMVVPVKLRLADLSLFSEEVAP